MRILVVGAGAIGGYFGGRLLAGRPRRDLSGPAPARRRTRRRRPRDQEPEWRRDAEKSADGAGGRSSTETFDVVLLSCKAFDLDDAIKSFAPAVGPQTVDHPAAQRHAASGRARQQVRARARARRALRDRGHAQRTARGGSSAADAVADLRRARRQAVGSRPRHRGSVGQRQVRLGRQRTHHSGHVGEMGVPGLAGGLDLPDAQPRSAISWPRRAARISSSACSTNAARSRPPRAMRPARRSWSAPAAC